MPYPTTADGVAAIRQLVGIRKVLGRIVATVAPEDLFRMPQGFVNHIAWNAAHVVVTQQRLNYSLSGLDLHLPEDLVVKYQKGSGPADGDEASYREVMAFIHRGPELLGEDYANGRFKEFTHYTTSAGFQLETIDDAIVFNNFHEGIHLGYIMALRKALAAG